MTNEIKEAQKRRDVLSHKTDSLNEAIEAFEAVVRQAHLGVAAKVLLRTRPDAGAPPKEEWLLWTKHSNAWRLMFVGFDEVQMPLVASPRSARLYAAGKFETLVEALAESIESEILRVEDATSKTIRATNILVAALVKETP